MDSGNKSLFIPSPDQAISLNRKMKKKLARSFDHIVERAGGILSIDTYKLGELKEPLLSDDPINPALFGLYYDLLGAISRGDNRLAQRLLSESLDLEPLCDQRKVLALSDKDLSAKTIEIYKRNVDIEADTPLYLAAPSDEDIKRVEGFITQARSLLQGADPELAAEIEQLNNQIILAISDENSDGIEFHGASSVYLWGALFINAAYHQNLLQVLDTLIHETAHTLLFGLSIDGPLVNNPYGERHSSPLRYDPRPMDGIYHATFVLARMHYGLSRLLASGLLDADSAHQAEEMLEHHAKCFVEGLDTIETSGQLTVIGEEILQSAKSYMQSAGVV
jgi:hypothetical protein